MARVLVIYYSQTGETSELAQLFAAELTASGAEVLLEPIRPTIPYRYPWRSVRRFFNEMPNAILGISPPIEPLSFRETERFDLVVLCYPVWFLSAAPPIRAFFRSPQAAVLRDTDVVTVSVSRAAWQRASVTVKELLAAAGARHIDNIVATHQGSPITTLVSTPRALLLGRRDSLLKVFPRAGVSDLDRDRVRRLAALVANQLPNHAEGTRLLRGEPAVSVNRRMAVPELLAWYCFYGWARLIDVLGRAFGSAARSIAVVAFAVFLVILILIGLPLTLLGTLVLAPFIRRPLDAYIARLSTPGAVPAELDAVIQNPADEEIHR